MSQRCTTSGKKGGCNRITGAERLGRPKLREAAGSISALGSQCRAEWVCVPHGQTPLGKGLHYHDVLHIHMEWEQGMRASENDASSLTEEVGGSSDGDEGGVFRHTETV